MRRFKLASAALLAATAMAATNASAAITVTGASVTGPSGTVWNTTVDGFYTLFLQNPFGTVLNPNDNFGGFTINDIATQGDFDLAGDGWVRGTTNPNDPNFNSDPNYTLSVTLTDGSTSKTVSGIYTLASDTYASTNSVRFGSQLYSISAFDWNRSKANLVGSYSVGSRNDSSDPGAKFDYQGAFSVTAGAVPEPATWAMLIFGFGSVAGAMRSRRRPAVSFA